MKHQHTNHLINETSPYLLQHAHNPVDWYPWNDVSLEKARKENKMMIISIGYSSCHWCHVMEHESFEDSAVARIMNDHFINIKVDREERPDIDDVYMTACQLSSQRGCGWPLNSFALPDGRPVWAGTYFPKKNWIEILEYFRKTFAEEPGKLEEYADQLVAGINHHGLDTLAGEESLIDQKSAAEITKTFLLRMDPRLGGRRGAPKFPMPNNWQYLMHYAWKYDHSEAADQVITTLDKMQEGGIYDQLEGGFARYSTDDRWLVPHFEKMLYDNGQLVSLYAQAFAWTQDQEYLKTIRQTLDFVEEYWSDPSGGFYSSFDADSEGEEGKYYVWSADELQNILTDERQRAILFSLYDISERGNWEHGKNILHLHRTIEEVARQQNTTVAELEKTVDEIKKLLIQERRKRTAPGLDDKILASWNGLMLQGYIDAFKATGESKYLERAKKNADFIKINLIKEGYRLDRNYKNGKSTINAFLDDYANVIQAFLSLYQVTFEIQWLRDAEGLTKHVLDHFDMGDSSMFYYTSTIDPPLVARRVEISDNVIPSGNSTMARNLYMLGELTYQTEYIERAKRMLNDVWPLILRDGQPSFYSNWCQLLLTIIQPPYEVAIVGEEFNSKLRVLQKKYLPDVIWLGGREDTSLPLLKGKLSPGQTLIYVCQNKTCKLPTEDVDKALSLMK